jgi:DNA-binding transcriptional MerR regulator
MDETYTVKQLAKLAGVSVRTLHYYDQLGLLKPDRRRNGYRQYGPAAALRLQQILFFRELGFPLAEVREILARPDFDVLAALTSQKELLAQRAGRLQQLLATVDRTMASIKGERDMAIKEYYEGFGDDQVENWRREARERYGEKAVAESEHRVLKMGKERFAAVQKEIDAVYKEVVANMDKGPASPEVQALVKKWRQWLENFAHYTDEMALGLARMYSSDERFADFYRKYHQDLPAFWTKAIEVSCGVQD